MWWQETLDNPMAWNNALFYCETSTLAGYTDWRLPTKKELRSLVDHSRFNPAINTTHFQNTVSSLYWSSTADAGYTYVARGVDFGYGSDDNNGMNMGYYVRAVRGGQSGSLGNLVIAQQPMSGPPARHLCNGVRALRPTALPPCISKSRTARSTQRFSSPWMPSCTLRSPTPPPGTSRPAHTPGGQLMV